MKEYEFDGDLQKKILYLYLRKSELREVILPAYFTHPVIQDIARWVTEEYEKHPDSCLTETSLRSLVKKKLGRKREEAWRPSYKPLIKELFKLPKSDDDYVEGEAVKFAEERKFRKALVSAENDVNNQNYDAAIKRFEALRGSGTETLPDQGYDWPKSLREEAFQGLAGEIVRAIEPCTEADEAGLLLQLLVGFGNIVGRNAWLRVGGSKHYPNLFSVLVGNTAKARKGTAWSEVRPFLNDADHDWAKHCILPGGLASGEGLIWSVRDRIERSVKPERNLKQEQDVPTAIDKGVSDKRRLILSTEFSSTVRVMQKDGNILSETLRQAFDGADLNNQSKKDPARATGAHISIVAHCTQGETLRVLGGREGDNGFVNRFLWVCVKRRRILPDPKRLRSDARAPLVDKLRSAIRSAREAHEVRRSPNALELYKDLYRKLSIETPGQLGNITARAEVMVNRLSLIYALLEGERHISTRHLKAALAVWEYCEASAQCIFGASLGYPDAEKLLEALRKSSKGLSRTDISRLFGGHKKAGEIEPILKHLKDRDLAKYEDRATAGPPQRIWTAKRIRGAK